MKSDMQLRQDVEAELDWCAHVDARQVGVAVKDGIVTLTGRVDSYLERRCAEEAAQSIAGVRAVANDLSVDIPPAGRCTDADIAAAALEALKSRSGVPADRIRVVVRDGCIELQGKVSTWHQKTAAEAAVCSLRGVRSVNSVITIHPDLRPGDIARKIEAAFRRQAQLDERHIKVSSHGHTVTLDGVVHTWQERSRAEAAAWQAPGVAQVIDNLEVRPRSQ